MNWKPIENIPSPDPKTGLGDLILITNGGDEGNAVIGKARVRTNDNRTEVQPIGYFPAEAKFFAPFDIPAT